MPHSGHMPEAGVGHLLAEHARLVTSDHVLAAVCFADRYVADLKSSPWGWRDAVAVKNSPRGRELSSLYPRGSQQASATPSAGDLVTVGLSGYL